MNDDERQVHTTPEEGHPAGDGERTDREVGGPASGDGQDERES